MRYSSETSESCYIPVYVFPSIRALNLLPQVGYLLFLELCGSINSVYGIASSTMDSWFVRFHR